MGSHAVVQLLSRLRARGAISQQSVPDLGSRLSSLPASARGAYAGFDPTGPSLHVGHLTVLCALARLQRAGVRPVVVLGGATALIGDPSGRSSERPMLSADAVRANLEGISSCVSRVLDVGGGAGGGLVLDNASWYDSMGALKFLREVGRHFRISSMLAKDTVKSRLVAAPSAPPPPGALPTNTAGSGTTPAAAGSGTATNAAAADVAAAAGTAVPPTPPSEGMSFTEFSYPLLQAWDFWWLHRNHGVSLQLGGQDQWGNIAAGIDFVHRRSNEEAASGEGGGAADVFGMTVPLVTTADGAKLGKSTMTSSGGGGVWLLESLTSHHRLYQYLLNVSDGDAARLLPLITTLPDAELDDALSSTASGGGVRGVQRALAAAVLRLVRGEEALQAALRCAALLHIGPSGGDGSSDRASPSPASTKTVDNTVAVAGSSSSSSSIRAEDIAAMLLSGDLPPSHKISGGPTALRGTPFSALAVSSGLCASRAEARRLLKAGGLYANRERLGAGGGGAAGGEAAASEAHLIGGRFVLLAAGRHKHAIIEVV